MAVEDEGLPKPNKEPSKHRIKTASSSNARRSKQFLDRRRLQHPESFPPPKKQASKQVFPGVESFRGSALDMKQYKDCDVRNQRTPSAKDSLRSSSKPPGKSWNPKTTRNHSVEADFTSQGLPDKFMMKVFKVKTGNGSSISVSDTNLISSGVPNFVLCCTSNSFAKEEDKQNRSCGGAASPSPSETSQLCKKTEKESDGKKPSLMCETMCQAENRRGSEIQQKIQLLVHNTDSNDLDAKCSASAKDINVIVDASADIDVDPSTKAYVDVGTDPDADQEKYENASEELKKLQDMICVRPSIQRLSTSSNNPDSKQKKSVEITSTDCGESSDEQGESDDCQQESQNDTALRRYNNNDSYDCRPMCTCYCRQEPIRNTQTEIQIRPEQNWLQIQNRNQMFSYPLCCPEGGAYYGCGCGGSPIAPLSTLLAPPAMQAMQPIQPSSPPIFQPQSYTTPTSRYEANSQQLSGQEANRNFPPNRKSDVSTDEENMNSRGSQSCQEKNTRETLSKRERLSRKECKTQSTRSSTSKKRRDSKRSSEEGKFQEDNSFTEPDLSRTGFNQAKSQSRQSISAREFMPGSIQPQQNIPPPTTWTTSCYAPNPFYGCNMCPPYHSPWGFSWWYSGFPFSFESCYTPMAAAGNNIPQPLHPPILPDEHGL